MASTICGLFRRIAIIVVTVVALAQAAGQPPGPPPRRQGQQLMRENERIVTATDMASEH
jgi:hypothetical protein